MATITKETIIGDILDMDQSTAPYFLEMGMHCLGCPASRGGNSGRSVCSAWSRRRYSGCKTECSSGWTFLKNSIALIGVYAAR